MLVFINLIAHHPVNGPISIIDYDKDFKEPDNLEQLLDPNYNSIIEIVCWSSNCEILIRDYLDGLILGICKGGLHALKTREPYINLSLAGYDAVKIYTENGLACLSDSETIFKAPIDETIIALEEFQIKYGKLLKRVFPNDKNRWETFLKLSS